MTGTGSLFASAENPVPAFENRFLPPALLQSWRQPATLLDLYLFFTRAMAAESPVISRRSDSCCPLRPDRLAQSPSQQVVDKAIIDTTLEWDWMVSGPFFIPKHSICVTCSSVAVVVLQEWVDGRESPGYCLSVRIGGVVRASTLVAAIKVGLERWVGPL